MTNKTRKSEKRIIEEDMQIHAVLPYSVYRDDQWLVYNIANDKEAQEQVKQRLRKIIAGLERSIEQIEAVGGR